MFWEARNTVLLRKFRLAWIVSPWVCTAWPVALASIWLLDSSLLWQILVFFLLWFAVFLSCQPQLLVDKHSATLSDFDSQRLNRSHVMMNKFTYGKGGEIEDFELVSGKIAEMLQKIREGSPLEKADRCIRTEHYSADRLQIERLSGDVLPLDRCYINLAIVKQPHRSSQHAEEGSGEKSSSSTSPFSLSARLNVERPEEDIQVDLPSLFDPRIDPNGQPLTPRRISIRGRAGVGKTTLCKKMVAEFIRPSGNFDKWKQLFDRVLWVPLRRLKEWAPPPSNLEELFLRIYFNQKDKKTGTALAQELQHVVEKGRTLFIFDGLDEIAGLWNSDHYMLDFITDLLQQRNAIITSRPHVSLPATVRPPDLELETVGFYPDQVKAYLQATFTDSKKVEHVQSYLQAHPLIQGLVRILIQLDALCYSWDNFSSEAVPQTMTAIYNAIEENLWKKDILRLGKRVNGEPVMKDDIKYERMEQIENLVDSEVFFLQGLAFTGLCNDMMNFELKHREAISKEFKLSNKIIYWDKALPHLSFLRTSDPSSKDAGGGRDYHFLHLTFQEYFAARYFVRQWKAKQPLKCLQLSEGGCNQIEPAALLQEHKYDPRYDIFWRFVAGLLDADSEALSFFQEIEKEPRDLLGPTHQRLAMHCLSEVEGKDAAFAGFRTKLEKQLEQWLLFECELRDFCWLPREIECPEQVLVNALKQASEDSSARILRGLEYRDAVPSGVVDVAISWLEGCASKYLCATILRLLSRRHKALQAAVFQSVAARLEDEDRDVRWAAIEVLQDQANITGEMVQAIAGRLEDEYKYVRLAAIDALQGRSDLTEEMVQGIAAQLEDEDNYVRWAAIDALQGRSDFTEKLEQATVQASAEQLEDEDQDGDQDAPMATVMLEPAVSEASQDQANLTGLGGMSQGITAQLEDEDRGVSAAFMALLSRAHPTDGILRIVAANPGHSFWPASHTVVDVMLNQGALSLGVVGPNVESFYGATLNRSFEEHVYLCISDTALLGVGHRRVPLEGTPTQGHELLERIREIRDGLGVPPPASENVTWSVDQVPVLKPGSVLYQHFS